MQFSIPQALTSMIRCQFSRVMSRKNIGLLMPALLSSTLMLPNSLHRVRDGGRRLLLARHVEPDVRGRAARGADLLGDGRDAVHVDVADADLRALRGVVDRHGGAHPLGASGDEDVLAGQACGVHVQRPLWWGELRVVCSVRVGDEQLLGGEPRQHLGAVRR